jgi:hypothetical protein
MKAENRDEIYSDIMSVNSVPNGFVERERVLTAAK